jgi:hypothetical protein
VFFVVLKRFWFVLLFIVLVGVLIYLFLSLKKIGVVGEQKIVQADVNGVGNVSFAEITGGVVVLKMERVPLLLTWPFLVVVFVLLELFIWKFSRRKV